MHLAAAGNFTDVVVLLVDAGADPNAQNSVRGSLPQRTTASVTKRRARAQSQRTALHVAVACDAADSAIYLLENGARMDIKDEVPTAGPACMCLTLLPGLNPTCMLASGAALRWSVHGMRRCVRRYCLTRYALAPTSTDACARAG